MIFKNIILSDKMYKIQKKLLEMENELDEIKTRKEQKQLLSDFYELRQMKNKMISMISEINNSIETELISKLIDSDILEDKEMPYIVLKKEYISVLQHLKTIIYDEFRKTYEKNKYENLSEILVNYLQEDAISKFHSFQESNIFFTNFVKNLLLLFEIAKENLHVIEANSNKTSMSSWSITVDFENCDNNPNVAASSPKNELSN